MVDVKEAAPTGAHFQIAQAQRENAAEINSEIRIRNVVHDDEVVNPPQPESRHCQTFRKRIQDFEHLV